MSLTKEQLIRENVKLRKEYEAEKKKTEAGLDGIGRLVNAIIYAIVSKYGEKVEKDGEVIGYRATVNAPKIDGTDTVRVQPNEDGTITYGVVLPVKD